MKRRLTRMLAILDLLFVAGISIPTVLLDAPQMSPATLAHDIFEALIVLFFAVVGALIVIRQPKNSIGWLFCVAAMVWALSAFSLGYADYALIMRPGALPAADWLGTIGNSTQSLGFFLIFTYLLLLFPTGQLPSPRWRPLFVAVTVFLIGVVLATLLGAPVDNNTRLASVLKNPIAILDDNVSNIVQTLLMLGLFIVSILCGVSLIARARHASGVERQQIKWLGYTAILCVAFVIFLVFAVFAWNGNVSDLVFYLPLVAIAGATGISILRYRLFDIDVLINRTLVYGSLTAILVAMYFVGVVGAQALINALTGQHEQQSPVLIVVTTLLVAALFQPLRQRMQRFIDRRFYRGRYDARKLLDKFGASLRSEVELTHLTSSLLETVETTMHPAHVSLWLRGQSTPPTERNP
jgi:hypothetical protein